MKTNLLKSFAVTLFVVLPLIGFLGVARIHAAPALHGTVPAASHQVAPRTVTSDLVDPVMELPEMIVTGKAPQKAWTMPKASAPKKWTCSAPRALVQGPVAQTVRDCEWR